MVNNIILPSSILQVNLKETIMFFDDLIGKENIPIPNQTLPLGK